jgi:hypothetical protein
MIRNSIAALAAGALITVAGCSSATPTAITSTVTSTVTSAGPTVTVTASPSPSASSQAVDGAAQAADRQLCENWKQATGAILWEAMNQLASGESIQPLAFYDPLLKYRAHPVDAPGGSVIAKAITQYNFEISQWPSDPYATQDPATVNGTARAFTRAESQCSTVGVS